MEDKADVTAMVLHEVEELVREGVVVDGDAAHLLGLFGGLKAVVGELLRHFLRVQRVILLHHLHGGDQELGEALALLLRGPLKVPDERAVLLGRLAELEGLVVDLLAVVLRQLGQLERRIEFN